MKLSAKNIGIVLIDDDLEDRMFFEEALQELNAEHNYRRFQCCHEALIYLTTPEAVIPDILLLNLNLPSVDGKAFLKTIRAIDKFAPVPIAIYATSSTDQDKHETFTDGANIYITKPRDYYHLRETLKKVIKLQWQYQYLNLNIHTFMVSL
ncbi:response regulator [Flavobacterium zepuense]|uniref:Response regulator n=1 Tax=Flavobacterium zepuense TaxID=2593302 RepID=A0A552UZP1_9FLAO|nr:response regulator [Flavobacterium zepuense]TRW23687.1 response regulator [Flavobacterium zepuense]